MKFRLTNSFSQTAPSLLRSCGYFAIVDRRTAKKSYIRELTKQRYPRFHVYLEEKEHEITVDLHLDQSKTRYQGQTAHNADYESNEVAAELTRIFEQFKRSQK